MTERARDYYFRDLDAAPFKRYSNSELVVLQQKAIGGDKQAWEDLWLHGVRLVHKICKKFVDIGLLHMDYLDDALQEGNLAIGKALPHWSNNQGRYSTYIWVCARKAIQRFIQEEYAGGITGDKPSEEFHLSYEEDIGTGGWSSLMMEFYNHAGSSIPENDWISEIDVEAALSILSDREEYILRKYYLDDQGDAEIAVLTGVDRSVVTKQRNTSLNKLRMHFS